MKIAVLKVTEDNRHKIESSFKNSGGSSVSQNKLLQLILGLIYILKYLQSNIIG